MRRFIKKLSFAVLLLVTVTSMLLSLSSCAFLLPKVSDKLPDGKYLYFPISVGSVNSRSDSLQPLESDCYELQLPGTFVGSITINVTFSETGNMQLYGKESSAQLVETCSQTSNSQTLYTVENCEDYLKIRIIISNTGSSSTNYIVTVTPG